MSVDKQIECGKSVVWSFSSPHLCVLDVRICLGKK